jgi:uncharacterized protein YaaR (DUF327 family)
VSELKIEIMIDRQSYSQEQLELIQFEREKHVLHEMTYLGADIKDGGKTLSYDDINYLSKTDAKRVLGTAKLELGAKGLTELYKERLRRSAQMWKDIIKEYVDGEPFQEAITRVKVTGITIEEFQKSMMKSLDDEASVLSANPEHFGFAYRETGEVLIGIETMGMYGDPVEGVITSDPNVTLPIKTEEDGFRLMMAGYSKLSDGTDMHVIAAHQVKPNENGFELKLMVFFPQSTPKELVDGHKIHLALEFLDALQTAYKEKLS